MAGRLQTKVKHFLSISFLLYFVMACKPVRDTTDLFYYHTDSVQPGDIILRKSYGLISDIITSQLKDTVNISHCGILDKNEKGEFYVIHTLSKMVSDYDGMQSCSLEEFLNDSRPETVRVVRFKNTNSKNIADNARYYLKEKIPFDDSFNIGDTTTFYCSELPIHIIRNIFGTDISFNAQKPKFSLFMNPDFFSIIPFMYKKSPDSIADR